MSEGIKETAAAVLKKVRIEDVIGEYVTLKRAGKRYAAVCPFHSDKDPSLSVSPEKGFFHCFGCGAGGNVISFVMKIEGISYSEALEKLSKRAGLEFAGSADRSEFKKRKDSIEAIIRESALFYYNSLHGGYAPKAEAYLADRGISEGASRRFGLGYAPPGKANLLYHLQSRGFGEDEIIESGMAVRNDDGSVYDLLRNRITIPLLDHMGSFMAMAGRALEDGYAKYMNTPETAFFTKGKSLFGLNLSKAQIQKEDRVIIVEGYFDMISMWQSGIKNVCASMGTALTQNQAELLRKFASEAVLLYDSDSAGKSAAARNAGIFYNAGIVPSVASIPEGHDPDSFVREHGAEALAEIINSPLDIIEFYIKRQKDISDISTPSGKSEFIRAIAPHIAKLKDMVVQSEYIKKISEASEVSESVTRRIVSGQIPPGTPISGKSEKTMLPEERLTAILLRHPEISEKISEKISPSDIPDETLSIICGAILEGGFKEPLKAEDFSAYSENEGLTEKIIELLLFENMGAETKESAAVLAEELAGLIKDNLLKEKFRTLKKEIEEALKNNNLEHDDEKYIEYRRLYQYFKGRKI
ncbi:MAG: DNA primase [bacterium]|nr:DNA primase [bacterium]